jgi:hypothetical protein
VCEKNDATVSSAGSHGGFNFLNCFSHHIFQITSIAMENFSVNPAKRRRLEYVQRQFPCFNCCSPLLTRRRRYNAVAKIGDSLVAPDVRMVEVVIGS